PIVKELAENSEVFIRKHPYHTPENHIENGKTYLETAFGDVPIQVFGKHNLSNLAGAQWICLHLGINEEMFYEAIASFSGAGKRLEKMVETKQLTVFKDFAHAPSKVTATVNSVKAQFKDKKVTACFELHTYSSLNPVFLEQYQNSMQAADAAVVFYDLEALKIKNMVPISPDEIRSAFGRKDLIVFTEAASFRTFLSNQNPQDDVWLLMSSGNYGGVNFEELKQEYC
ncbi:MAG: peptidoglycan synthetase, partial [Flavobacteriaceae bacterium]|nr:peptidoglycan synthetase [Flavobacteriaceae bacterium]